MNANLIQCYQELVDAIAPLHSGEWKTFRLKAAVDESGLGLRLKFITADGTEEQLSPVPFEIFDIMEEMREATGSDFAWSEWTFDCDREGKYDITIRYPEA